MPRVATKLMRKADGSYWARRRIPVEVRDEYLRLYGKRAEERFSTTTGISEKEARRLWKEWSADVDARFANIRASQRGEGVTLSRQEARALAGEWYHWFVGKYGAGEIHGAYWDDCRDAIQQELQSHAPNGTHPDLIWHEDENARAAIRPLLADTGQTAQFLAAKGTALSPVSRTLFLDFLFEDLAAALSLLVRRAEGDYSDDTYPKRFPKLQTSTGVTAEQLFKSWIEAQKPARGTVDRWRGVFIGLKEHFGGNRPVGSILPEEAQTWADRLITTARSASTVRDVWVSAASTVCTWGVKRKLITADPFANVHVTVPRKTRERETKAFADNEAHTILAASLAITTIKTPLNAAKRWVPWLCAYTGARGGEIAQARGTDVIVRDAVHALRISPEAGTVKTGTARTVPLHEHLVAQGFLEFAQASGNGPLFYNPNTKPKTEDDPTNPRKPRYIKTRERIAEWVRSLGVTDPELQPNHAWRHTFKQRADRAGITDRVSDAITGHAPPNVARSYGKPTLPDMAAALEKFPRYEVDGDSASAPRKLKPKRKR